MFMEKLSGKSGPLCTPVMFDIQKEAGSLHALTKTFSHLRRSPEGKLDLTFDPIVNYATVSAIEVIDESE